MKLAKVLDFKEHMRYNEDSLIEKSTIEHSKAEQNGRSRNRLWKKCEKSHNVYWHIS